MGYKVRNAAFIVVVGLILLNAIMSVRQMWTWVRPFDRFASRPWPEYGIQPYTVMAAPFLKLADALRGLKAVGFVNGYPNLEQRMMAQSMLAPTLITSDARPQLVIAAFPTDHELDSFLAGPPPEESGPLTIRRRFSPGMALLEHTGHTERVQHANAPSPIVEVEKSVGVLWLILSLASLIAGGSSVTSGC